MKISINSKTLKAAGFTVVEVTMAAGLSGLVLTSVLAGFSSAFDILQTARENLRATQIVQEKMETIRLYNWDQMSTPGFIPATFTSSSNPTNNTAGTIYNGTITIKNAPVSEVYSNNLKQVTVSLSWTTGKTTHQRQITSFISQYGLQNYIY
jgi:hypothetical protein